MLFCSELTNSKCQSMQHKILKTLLREKRTAEKSDWQLVVKDIPRRANLYNSTRNVFELDEKRACLLLLLALQHKKTVPMEEQGEKNVMELFLKGKKSLWKNRFLHRTFTL